MTLTEAPAPYVEPVEHIIAAAVQIEGVTLSLPRPARHGQVMTAALLYVSDAYKVNNGTQGFLTSTGRFVNRVQARHIAYMAGQNPGYSGNQGSPELFSEDLW